MSGLAMLSSLLLGAAAAGPPPESATLEGDRLVLTTGRVTREFRWNGGHVAATMLRDEHANRVWRLAGDKPDLSLPGLDIDRGENGRLAVTQVAGDAIEPGHLLVTITTRVGAVGVTRRCKLFRMSPAIGCSLTLTGAPPSAFAIVGAREAGMIEDDAGGARGAAFVTDRLGLSGRHWRADAVRFFAATDHNDTLVDRASSLLYREDKATTGNILLLRETAAGGAIFVLKEAPAGADQLGWTGRDFLLRTGDVRIVGSGFSAQEAAQGAVHSYAVVVGVAEADETSIQLALRDHFATVRQFDPARDSMLMSNTWGDRSRDSRMNEAFLLGEIEAAARLGLTHVQLDDGWQAGLSRNSANRAGQRWEDWSADDWRAHPTRFPRGLAPLVDRARRHGIRLGLWFNPSQANAYAAWARDADILIGYWRDHGIASVKIDGIQVDSHEAERNLANFLDRIRRATGGRMVINMDVTAGRRPGYFHRNRYGNLFLENRYTDWGNYYPHRTLRNVWMLGQWLPPQWLQAEFLNVARNPASYNPDDPLAPAAVGQSAGFAKTLVAQPLAWMELAGLSEPARTALTEEIAAYRAIQGELHNQAILPIGDAPDGAGWTGFQSASTDRCSGFLIVYREPLAVPDRGIFTLPFAASDYAQLGGAQAAINVTGRQVEVTGIKQGGHAIWRWRDWSGQCPGNASVAAPSPSAGG